MKIDSHKSIVISLLSEINEVVGSNGHLLGVELDGKASHGGFANGVDWHVDVV